MNKKLFISALLISLLEAYTYIGCYRDSGNRDLKGYSFSSNAMQIDDCAFMCKRKGFKYMGLQYSSYCFCGNDFGKYGKADNCNMPCNGNPNEICGGSWANSIYKLSTNSDDFFHKDPLAENWFKRWTIKTKDIQIAKIPNSNQKFGWRKKAMDIGDAMPPKYSKGAVLYLHPKSPQQPTILKTSLKVTSNNEIMKIRIAGNRNGDFALIVKVNGQEIFKQTVNGKKWHTYEISLERYLGQNINIEIDISANGWYYEYAFIDEISFETKKIQTSKKSKMTIKECGVYQDPEGKDYDPHKKANLNPYKMIILVSCKVYNIKKGTPLTGSWYFLNQTQEELISTKTFKITKDIKQDYITFIIQSDNMKRWPKGEYKVIISSNGKEYGKVNFNFK